MTGDAVLAALGIHRLVMPVPFPDAGGAVNAYAIEDVEGGVAFFDTGIGTPEGEAALRSGAAAAGVELGRCTHLLVSHGHVDHVGNAQLLAEASGAPVWIHDSDREKVAGESAWERWAPRYTAYLRRQGVPEEQLPRLVAIWKHSGKFSRRVDPERVRSLEEGQHFRFARIEVEVMHLPGHTPGLVCLWDAEHRVLFADDHVLARTSPNPFLELHEDGTTFRALVRYFQSIRRVRSLEVAWVLPGHGEPFQEHRALIDRLLGFYRRRQEKLLQALKEGPRTGVALSAAVFGPQEGARLYLTLSEVIGNLEVLEDDGRVRRLEDGPVDLWAAVN